MKNKNNSHKNKRKPNNKRLLGIIVLEVLLLLALFGTYRLYIVLNTKLQKQPEITQEDSDQVIVVKEPKEEKLSPQELEVIEEQKRLRKEEQERKDLVAQADLIALGYDYEGAIALIKSYQGSDGNYKVYPYLTGAIERLEKEESALVLYGGSYQSITEINHLFIHSLVVDTSLAFDSDYDSKGYNMYMTTVSEFNKMLQKLYEDDYVLIRTSDVAKQITLEDGTTKYVANEIYLKPGKKPIILSEDDVSFYAYMDGDGFASKIILDENGNPTCEMTLADGTTTTGLFDMVPIVDAFVKEHPDFSYKGAKGLLALTGYEGILGYRTNDKTSPTYEQDVAAAKEVAKVLKEDGWEFGSHSWGHLNLQKITLEVLQRDTNRWLEEVGSIVGPTDIFVFPFGIDIETTTGVYSSDKYQYLKESGFNYFLGVYKQPWMHIKKDYVRMTRRPIDGQAMLEFPDRLTDLFVVEEILDESRPAKNW